jgi:hypothetical protein
VKRSSRLALVEVDAAAQELDQGVEGLSGDVAGGVELDEVVLVVDVDEDLVLGGARRAAGDSAAARPSRGDYEARAGVRARSGRGGGMLRGGVSGVVRVRAPGGGRRGRQVVNRWQVMSTAQAPQRPRSAARAASSRARNSSARSTPLGGITQTQAWPPSTRARLTSPSGVCT